ncbi:MAG: helix-turn-helix domain-containing protein [Firmicutes bacterium]|nr:helix-turn-helix domain-containing protein [Bacillota bacterium]
MTLGDYISKYRKQHNYSMDEFAARSGLSKAYISILERNFNPSTGKAAIPSLSTIKRVASTTGADFNDIIALLDGETKVLLDCGEVTASANATPFGNSFSDLEIDLIHKFRQLDERGQAAVINVLNYEYSSLPGDAAVPGAQNA